MGETEGEHQIATDSKKENWERVRRKTMKGRDRIKRRRGDRGQAKKRGKQRSRYKK